jgi:hypothetical protein
MVEQPPSATTAATLTLAACTTVSAKGDPQAWTTADAKQLQQLVNEAHAKYKGVNEGKNADYIPILATVPSELFGVAIATRDGTVYTAGDVDYRFSIQSVSKPFTAALVMQQNGGPKVIRDKIGEISNALVALVELNVLRRYPHQLSIAPFDDRVAGFLVTPARLPYSFNQSCVDGCSFCKGTINRIELVIRHVLSPRCVSTAPNR